MDVWALLDMSTKRLVTIAGLVGAVIFLWTKVVAPLVFRPIGKALAQGARREAEHAVKELVDPQLDLLRQGQASLTSSVESLAATVGQVLDRMPPNQ